MARASYVHGNSGAPLIGATIGDFLKSVAAAHGAQEALIVQEQGVRWTYAELLERSDAFAAGLLSLGLKPGDRIGIWSPNCAEWAIAQFATARAGFILVTVNPAYRTSELEHALKAVECRALIMATRFRSSDYIAILRELAPELGTNAEELVCARLPALRRIITLGDGVHAGCIPFAAVSARATPADHDALEMAAADIQMDDPFAP
jgi:fatty-acyl-CoA synthase